MHNDKQQAIPVDFGTITNLKPVIHELTDVDVAPSMTVLSTGFLIVFKVSYFYIFFWYMVFVYEKSNHFFYIVISVNKTVLII